MEIIKRFDELKEKRIIGIQRLKIINEEFGKNYAEDEKGCHVLSQYIYRQRKNQELKKSIEDSGINASDVKHGWKKTEEGSFFFKNPFFEEESTDYFSKFDEICEKYINKFPSVAKNVTIQPTSKILQVIISDSHVGMNPAPDNKSLFQYQYSGKIYKEKLLGVAENIIKERKLHGKFKELVLVDLGDREDGFNKLTTRGGHSLPQNMSDAEVFETCIDAKIELLYRLLQEDVAEKIIIRDVVNSNHSAGFAHCVSIATQKLINAMFGNIVEVDILERFLEHRVFGDHTFIYTHGKDAEYQFKGLPLHLNDKAINFIQDYIDHYNINTKYIHVLKGDLHQIGFNKTRKFDYRNFPSFAPGSSWQQHNFGDSYSGYSIQVYEATCAEYAHTDYFLDYKKDASTER